MVTRAGRGRPRAASAVLALMVVSVLLPLSSGLPSPKEAAAAPSRSALYVASYTTADNVSAALASAGFNVQRTTTVPSSLSGYSLVVVGDIGSAIQASLSTIESYVAGGGGYVYLSGAAYYSELPTNAAWLGANAVSYTGVGENGTVSVGYPLGTSLAEGAVLNQEAPGQQGIQEIQGLQTGAQQIAGWSDGGTYAYMYSYRSGKVFYMSDQDPGQAGTAGLSDIETLLEAAADWAAATPTGTQLAWAGTSAYPTSVFEQPCASSLGYIYCVGGTVSGSGAYTDAVYATSAYGGSLETWNHTTSYPTATISDEPCAVSSGYIYCVGGYTKAAGSGSSGVYSAPVADETVGSWSNTTSYPVANYGASCVTYTQYIYCLGGYTAAGANTASASYATLSSGGVGPWASTTPLPIALDFQSCVQASGYVYCVGGYTNAVPENVVYYAQLSSRGIGAWTSTTPYPVTVYATSCQVLGGYIYCVGGIANSDGAATNGVYLAPVSTSGVGEWESAGQYPQGAGYQSCAASQNYIYCVGGYNGSPTNSVYSTEVGTIAPLSATAAAAPTSGTAPLSVQFTGSASGGIPPYSYSWSFGTGATSTAQNATYLYPDAGSFTAALTVTDSVGDSAASSVSVSVGSTCAAGSGSLYSLPECATLPSGSLETRATLNSVSGGQLVKAQPGEPFDFTVGYQIWEGANSSERDQLMFLASWTPTWPPPAGYYWGIYNAVPPAYPGTTGSTLFSLTAPSTPGTYFLWFVFDANSGYAQAASAFASPLTTPGYIEIQVGAPLAITASASANPTSGAAPLTVQFTGGATGGEAPYSYAWTFGDGSSSTQQNPTHTYTAAGDYAAELTVTDGAGDSATSVANVDVGSASTSSSVSSSSSTTTSTSSAVVTVSSSSSTSSKTSSSLSASSSTSIASSTSTTTSSGGETTISTSSSGPTTRSANGTASTTVEVSSTLTTQAAATGSSDETSVLVGAAIIAVVVVAVVVARRKR